MSGVWQFGSNGVLRLVENPLAEDSAPGPSPSTRRKVLVHSATNEYMSNFEQLEEKLLELGWKPYFKNQFVRQYHRCHHTVDLITLPPFFDSFRTTHMYDIVVKTRSAFRVHET